MRNATFFKNKKYPVDSSKFFTKQRLSYPLSHLLERKKRGNFQFFFIF